MKKKPNVYYYYYNIKLVSEKKTNQETERKSIFLSVIFSSLCAI